MSPNFLTCLVGDEPMETLEKNQKSKVKKEAYLFWYNYAKEIGKPFKVAEGWVR